MKYSLRLVLLLCLIAPGVTLAEPKRGAAATVHPLATQAAINALRAGGNAVDAAVAAAVTLGVVDGHNSGIGGGCFMLIRTADGQLIAFDGREIAPAAATREMFLRDGKGDTSLSQNGPLASGIPGSVAVFEQAVSKYGKRSLADAFTPAAELAEAGFPINKPYAERIAAQQKELARFPAAAALLLDEQGAPLKEGTLLKQPDLAKTYRGIASGGADYFYKGDFANTVATWMKANGGIIADSDFANYSIKQREPLVTSYRGHTIVGFPPPSSGGVHVAQILSILEPFDLKALHQQDPALRLHVILQAMKLAFADRAFWLGDPAFTKVPRGLIDANYGQELSKQIQLDSSLKIEGPGTPPGAKSDFFDDELTGRHTTHIATADADGTVVAITTTVNTVFGSKVIVPGTGVILNNQMDDFSIEPGVANAFGLVGADANAIAPGKRPLSSMSPTIVLKDNKPFMTIGAAGGPKIITQVVLGISNVVDLGDDLPTALARKRVHHQWKPDAAWIEGGMDDAIVEKLKALGNTLDVAPPAGATQAIMLDGGNFVP
ncbi:MAG TPA: gamma-glutamyltransferase, partial [Tepidisphaeraceae bacterium]